MELSKKTTVLLPPKLHVRLARLAARRGTSMGQLVREACEKQYGLAESEDRLAAVEELEALSLPVGSVRTMKRQSIPDPDDLLP